MGPNGALRLHSPHLAGSKTPSRHKKRNPDRQPMTLTKNVIGAKPSNCKGMYGQSLTQLCASIADCCGQRPLTQQYLRGVLLYCSSPW